VIQERNTRKAAPSASQPEIEPKPKNRDQKLRDHILKRRMTMDEDDYEKIISRDDELERVIDEIVQEIVPKPSSPTPPIESDSDLSIKWVMEKVEKINLNLHPLHMSLMTWRKLRTFIVMIY
jgi:hypothetical protein